MRPLRTVLAGVTLALVLALEALFLFGPRGLGLPGPGIAVMDIVAPTLLRVLYPGVFRPALADPPAAPATPPRAAGPARPAAAPLVSAQRAPVPVAASSTRTHTVQAGETLWEIARQYGVDVRSLAAANRGVDPGDLQVGQVLTVPSATGPAPAVAEPVAGKLARAFAWPALAPISSLFGPRWGGFHTGIDLAVPVGTSVHAARAGKVALAEALGGYGLCIIIDHGDGTKTLYAHNAKLLVAAGGQVSQGQVIAESGNTGHSTGPHLHFEIIVGNRPRNPLHYLPDVGLAVQENR